ncbi:MAG: RNA polymerase sigma-70 factor [Candidatus Cryptobacteroides sp.]
MTNDALKNDVLLVVALKYDSHEAFVKIFHQYYANLVVFASRFIHDKAVCEDIVQEAFVRVWNNRKHLEIKTSIRSYLTALVQNLALNELRHRKVRDRYESLNHEDIFALSPEEHLFYSELKDAVDDALDKMNPEVRETLFLSRRDKMKYADIAKKLNISTRTVEDRINKALKFLQKSLKDYKNLIIIFVICFLYNLL